jgi:hypothetical protein
MNTLRMLIRLIAGTIAGLIVFFTGAWGALALWFQWPGGLAARWIGSSLWVALVIGLFAMALLRRSWWPVAGYGLALLLLLGWWTTIRPSNDRIWADDVARLMHGSVEGSMVTLVNVRDFDWRSDSDYDVRWETRQYDLDRLVSADAILSYWSSKAIAHAMISFGFDDGRHVVFSVEIRRKQGEAFSSIGGFFKQFDMILVAADEGDIVRVRTNVRGEDDYLYPLSMDRATMRSLFLSYVEAANALVDTPKFYNTVTSNCTTLVYRMAKRLDPGLPLDIRLLLTGYLPGYLYDNHALDHRLSLDEWKRRGHFTERARQSRPGDDFSRSIRAGEGADAPPATTAP